MKLLWAYIRCHFYLLFIGMWRGECRFTAWSGNKVILICAGTGSFQSETVKVTRLFYSSVKVSKNIFP